MNRFLMAAMTVCALIFAAGLWIPLKALVAQELLALAWAESQARHTEQRPWPWADTWPVARLALPGSPAPLIVLAGSHGESLAFGPGEVSGADGGPWVIAGHRDTHFRSLDELAEGSLLRLQDRHGDWRFFEVTGTRIVDSRYEGLDLPGMASDSLTLITCYPFNGLEANGPMRYRVDAMEVPGRPLPGRVDARHAARF